MRNKKFIDEQIAFAFEIIIEFNTNIEQMNIMASIPPKILVSRVMI